MEGIRPEGWQSWKNSITGLDGTTTARYAEYGSKTLNGKKLDVSKRVKWCKQLSKKEAENYSIEKVLGGIDGWAPARK